MSLSNEIVIFFVLRRSFEWIAELQISERELEQDNRYAFLFTGIQIASFFMLVIAITSGVDHYFHIALLIWACTPGFQLLPFIIRMCSCEKHMDLHWKTFLPHIGSSWVIATTTYVFRLLIIFFAGKAVGGILFSAYAIGGMINSVYTYALGPSLAVKYGGKAKNKENTSTSLVVVVMVIVGVMMVLLLLLFGEGIAFESNYYPVTVGLSLMGGGIMLLAQRKRIHILQIDKDSVFVPDLLANILILLAVPISFYLLGVNGLSALFLWNAIITYIVYYQC